MNNADLSSVLFPVSPAAFVCQCHATGRQNDGVGVRFFCICGELRPRDASETTAGVFHTFTSPASNLDGVQPEKFPF